MYEDIKKNKIKTGIVVTIFFALVTLAIYAVCYMLDLGEYAIFIAMAFSIISTIATYYNCDKIVLASVRARPATHDEDLQLTNILDGLMVASGMQVKPRLYVVESNQPNAFATGRNPEHAVICVTTGLIEKLNYRELEGVVAHELSHIKNYDILLSAVISVMAGFVVMLSDIIFRSGFRGRRSSSDRDSSSGLEIALFVIGLVFLILSPIVTKLIQLAVSRRREYLADATAISFTRNPDGLISALQKISSDDSNLEVASEANSFMYIEEPNIKKRFKNDLFSTHPSIEDRINALENLK